MNRSDTSTQRRINQEGVITNVAFQVLDVCKGRELTCQRTGIGRFHFKIVVRRVTKESVLVSRATAVNIACKLPSDRPVRQEDKLIVRVSTNEILNFTETIGSTEEHTRANLSGRGVVLTIDPIDILVS